MTILSMIAQQCYDVTIVTVVSDLNEPRYWWYVDGSPVLMTRIPNHSFRMELGEQADIECIDTIDPAFDAVANAPIGWPARRTIFWVRALSVGAAQYCVEQSTDGETWTAISVLNNLALPWAMTATTPRLADLTTYYFRVVPLDSKGNQGTPLELTAEMIVRRPDAPNFSASFSADTGLVTFSAA